MNKIVELLEKEFELYEANDLSEEEVLKYLKSKIKQLKRDRGLLYIERTDNKLLENFVSVFRRRAFDLGYKDAGFYSMTNCHVSKQLDANRDFLNSFRRLSENVDSDNYQEVYRLASFAWDKYSCDCDAREEWKNYAGCVYNGFSFNEPRVKPISNDFMYFFKRTIFSTKDGKTVEKVKNQVYN